jgi:hypothetical protein
MPFIFVRKSAQTKVMFQYLAQFDSTAFLGTGGTAEKT